MKFSSKCRTEKLKMIYTILGFSSISNWEVVDIWPQIRPRKIPVSASLFWQFLVDLCLILRSVIYKLIYTFYIFVQVLQIFLLMYIIQPFCFKYFSLFGFCYIYTRIWIYIVTCLLFCLFHI